MSYEVSPWGSLIGLRQQEARLKIVDSDSERALKIQSPSGIIPVQCGCRARKDINTLRKHAGMVFFVRY
ncbi:MAG: hypothetical protein Q8K18_14470, partial [Burkholderiales bacterium]|nr:hypothetical protein [Burkholderiales bacterium]